MEIQKWDEPQSFGSDGINSDGARSKVPEPHRNHIHENEDDTKHERPQKNLNSNTNNGYHHNYGQSNDVRHNRQNHNYNNLSYCHNYKSKPYNHNRNHNFRKHYPNTHYINQTINDNYNFNHNQHKTVYKWQPTKPQTMSTEDVKSNSSDQTSEINNSKGTILYCPPKANKKSDIIRIAPYQRIPPKPNNCIRIIALGCTHELHNHVYFPNGDLLIHAGDTCNWRRYTHTQKIFQTAYDIWEDFVHLLNETRQRSKDNYKYGIYVVPGNHDKFVEQNTDKIKKLLSKNEMHLLINEHKTVTVSEKESFSIFGSPISWYRNKPSNAFQVHRGAFKQLWKNDDRELCHKYWDNNFIKSRFTASDILVCHGPCKGFGDCPQYGKGTGSYNLLRFVKQKKPKIFICSDFHGSGEGDHGYGIGFLSFFDKSQCILMNVAIAHTKARFMNEENIKRGVTIVDADLF